MAPLEISTRIVIPASELSWTAVRSAGPGGQNVNKVATKVELRFDLERTTVLSAACRARLRLLAAHRLDATGSVLITSQATRTQSQNLEDARAKLAALIRAALVVPKVRRPTKPTQASKRRRLETKQRTSKKKHERSRAARSDWS